MECACTNGWNLQCIKLYRMPSQYTAWMSTTVHVLHSCFQEKCYQLAHVRQTFIGQYVNGQQ